MESAAAAERFTADTPRVRVVNEKTVAHATVIRFPLYQALGLLALVVGLVVMTVLLRRHRNRLIERTVNDRLAQK